MSNYNGPIQSTLRDGVLREGGVISVGSREPNVVSRKLIYSSKSGTDVLTGAGYFVAHSGAVLSTVHAITGTTTVDQIMGVLKRPAVLVAPQNTVESPGYEQRLKVNIQQELANIVDGWITVYAASVITGVTGYKLAITKNTTAVSGTGTLLTGAIKQYTGITVPANSIDVSNFVSLAPIDEPLNVPIGGIVRVQLNAFNKSIITTP